MSKSEVRNIGQYLGQSMCLEVLLVVEDPNIYFFLEGSGCGTSQNELEQNMYIAEIAIDDDLVMNSLIKKKSYF
jgi:hypothetical protein